MNILEDGFTKIRFIPELNIGMFPWEACRRLLSFFSEFDDENSTKDAFSDILKNMVQKIFPMGYTPSVARFAIIQFQPLSPICFLCKRAFIKILP